jgi:hypothetical protein
MVGEHDRQHRLAYRDGADADARVVTALDPVRARLA